MKQIDEEIKIKKSRKAGILMPIFSLPSNYGIGTLGKEAYKFVDFLVDAKQTYWQILPIGQNIEFDIIIILVIFNIKRF